LHLLLSQQCLLRIVKGVKENGASNNNTNSFSSIKLKAYSNVKTIIMKKIIATWLFTIIVITGLKGYCQKSGTAEFKRSFLEHINSVRAAGCSCGTTYMPPAPPLVWNNDLEKSARGHAWDMSNNSYFSHTSKDGRSMEDRIVFCGLSF